VRKSRVGCPIRKRQLAVILFCGFSGPKLVSNICRNNNLGGRERHKTPTPPPPNKQKFWRMQILISAQAWVKAC